MEEVESTFDPSRINIGGFGITGFSFTNRSAVFIFSTFLLILLSISIPVNTDAWKEWRGDLLHSAISEETTPTNGDLIWSKQTGDQVLSSPVFYEGGLMIGSDDGWLYCLDPDTGDQIWKFKTDGPVQSTALIDNGRAYFGSFDHFFYCIELPELGESPEEIWKYDAGAQIISSAHITGTSLLFCDLDGVIHSVDLDGNGEWTNDLTDMEIWATPLIDEPRGLAYVGDTGDRLFSVYLDNGTIKDVMVNDPDCEIYSSGTLWGDIFYYTTGMNRKLVALDVEDWSVVWNLTLEHDTYSTPVVKDDRIYFGSFEYTWCAPVKDPNGDGEITEDEIIWSSPTQDYQGGSSPLVVDSRVYIGSDDHRVYCFGADDGDTLWSFETKGYVYSSPSIHNGSIYFGSSDRSVYCIGDRPPGLVAVISPDEAEITSDNILEIVVNVTDEEGVPTSGSIITFQVSAGYIAFDQEGNTRLSHETDENGQVRVYYNPVIVSSRSTVTITCSAEINGMRPGKVSSEVIVEPGSEVDSGSPEIGRDNQERDIHAGLITILVILNLLLGALSILFLLRNRNEAREENQ